VDGLQRPSGCPSPAREPHHHYVAGPGANPRSCTEISMGTRAHTTPIAPGPAPVKRSALGPAGHPPGDRTPKLALTHNEVAGPTRPPPTSHQQELVKPRLHR
jgi:hypothetical protein